MRAPLRALPLLPWPPCASSVSPPPSTTPISPPSQSASSHGGGHLGDCGVARQRSSAEGPPSSSGYVRQPDSPQRLFPAPWRLPAEVPKSGRVEAGISLSRCCCSVAAVLPRASGGPPCRSTPARTQGGALPSRAAPAAPSPQISRGRGSQGVALLSSQ